jgi:DNA repair protein RecN (Recombination protein N)
VLAEREAEHDRLAAEVAGLAARLTAARREAADAFASGVSAELAGLAMPHARIEVAVLPRPAGRGEAALPVDGQELGVGPDGADEVELRLMAHPGAPALPLQKGASGGELSRVMLAIEVVFAGVGGPPTLVFDEVDAGVGGRAAVEIGRRLARLARNHQVLVVTHLPQVAAFADRHLVVAKDSGGVRDHQRGTDGGGDRPGAGAGADAGRAARLRPGDRARRGTAGGGRPGEAG